MRRLLTVIALAFLIASCKLPTTNNITKEKVCFNDNKKQLSGQFTSHKNNYYVFNTKDDTYKVFLQDSIKAKVLFNKEMDISVACKEEKWYLVSDF